MLSFRLDPQYLQELTRMRAAFTQKYSELQTFSADEKMAIHRYAKISMIGASSRIENAILTDSEIDWIDQILSKDGKTTAFKKHKRAIENKLSKDRERSIEEITGCRSMLSLIYEQSRSWIPLTEVTVRGLHNELMKFGGKSTIPIGQYKTTPNSVVEMDHSTKKTKTIFRTADPGLETNIAMSELVDWYAQNLPIEAWTFALSSELVFRFLAIHPFQDGNGRIGRGLFLMSLLQNQDPAIAELARYLAIDRQIEKHKEEYYLVLMQCSEGQFSRQPEKYHMEIFLRFMLKILKESLSDIDYYRNKFRAYQDLTEVELEILKCFKDQPEKKITPKSLETQVTAHRRTINKVLTKLIKAHFIQKTGRGPQTKYQLVF